MAAKTTGTLTISQAQQLFNSKVGNRYLGRAYNGWCLKFVSMTWFRKLKTSKYYSWCCANTYGKMICRSRSMNDIPIGADVFFKGSNIVCGMCGHRAGHVGVYVGDGYMVHAWGRTIRKDKIIDLIKMGNYKFYGWGFHGGLKVVPDKKNSPKGKLESIEVKNNKITISGWAYDKNAVSRSLKIKFWDGSPSSGGKCYTIWANKPNSDVPELRKVKGRHRFKSTIKLKSKGKKKIYVYAVNVKAGNDTLIGKETVRIPSKHKK